MSSHNKQLNLKKVRFGLEDEFYLYEQDSPSLETEVEGGTKADHQSLPPWLSSSPSSVSTISTDGPFTPPLSPSSLDLSSGCKAQGKHESTTYAEQGSLWPNPILLFPSMQWHIVKPPTKTLIPHLPSCGDEPFIIYNPRKLPYVTLVHRPMSLWPIRISLKAGEKSSVEDFYSILHQHFNKPLGAADLAQFGKHDAIQRRFSQRCREWRLNATKESLRRIDCLDGHVFHGIRPTEDPEVWELVLL